MQYLVEKYLSAILLLDSLKRKTKLKLCVILVLIHNCYNNLEGNINVLKIKGF